MLQKKLQQKKIMGEKNENKSNMPFAYGNLLLVYFPLPMQFF